jgi:uncharacterized membrane protein
MELIVKSTIIVSIIAVGVGAWFFYKMNTGSRSTLYGTVTDYSGNPIPEVIVTIQLADYMTEPLQTLTDNEGKYNFDDVELGYYIVQFTAEGYNSITEYITKYRTPQQLDIQLQEG